jgi:hypothetical protein
MLTYFGFDDGTAPEELDACADCYRTTYPGDPTCAWCQGGLSLCDRCSGSHQQLCAHCGLFHDSIADLAVDQFADGDTLPSMPEPTGAAMFRRALSVGLQALEREHGLAAMWPIPAHLVERVAAVAWRFPEARDLVVRRAIAFVATAARPGSSDPPTRAAGDYQTALDRGLRLLEEGLGITPP